VKEGTYRRLHIPASSLITFMDSIHKQGRVGTLTVSFGTGGVPCGQLIWEERIVESTAIYPLTEENAYLHA